MFEDVVQKLIFNLLETNKGERLLGRIFGFFERMANSDDPSVSRDLLGIAILELLVYEISLSRLPPPPIPSFSAP